MVLVKGLQEQVAELKAANEELQRQLAESQRVCGGTRDAGMGARATHGLSPRVRGNHLDSIPAPVSIGSIPACAGEPAIWASLLKQPPVYPRVCGGTHGAGAESRTYDGLSPRVRGNPRIDALAVPRHRSIPACAGEPSLGVENFVTITVYPRVCGGTQYTRSMTSLAWGLSPRVRGNRRTRAPARHRPRSIPACAGEPPRPRSGRTRCAVYPRVCGGTPCNRYASLPSHKPKLYLTAQQTVFLASPVLRRSRRSSVVYP